MGSLRSTPDVVVAATEEIEAVEEPCQDHAVSAAGHEVKEIYAFGAGLESLLDVVGLHLFSNLEFLSLHDNDIDRIEGLESLHALRELNLSSNKIKEMECLSTLSQLQVLNLSCNRIEEIKDLQGLRALEKLVLSHNHIKSLYGLSALSGPRYSLRSLDLRDNRVDSISELRVLAGCIYLKELSFSRGNHTNPVCHAPAYRSSVIAATPHLYKLDGELLSGPVPGELSHILPQFGVRSYSDAAVPSWILQYASFSKSDPRYQDGERRYLPPGNNSNELQSENALCTSQPQVSVFQEQQHAVLTCQDGSGSRSCPPDPVHSEMSEGQYCMKAPQTTNSGCQQNLTGNRLPESKPVETDQGQETSSGRPAYAQALDWSDQPSSNTFNRVPSLSHCGSRVNSEDSVQEVSRTHEEPVENVFSCSTRQGLPGTDHSLNGFFRRRWPNAMRRESVLPARLKRVNFSDEVCDDKLLGHLERKILDLVHELTLAKRGATRGLQGLRPKSYEMTDYEIPEPSVSDDCKGGRRSRKGKETCCHRPEEEKHSSSSDASDNRKLKPRNKSRRDVRWSDEKIGRNGSGDSMRRWLVLVEKWTARMNLKKTDNSKSGAEGSELQKVLQLLNEEVKHLHQAVVSWKSVPKVEETQTRSEEPVDIISNSKDDEKDKRDLNYLAKCREDELAETKRRFHEEKDDLSKRLDEQRQTIIELETALKEKNDKLQDLLRQVRESFHSEREDPEVCPEDYIRQTIISAKAEIYSMENSLQKATVAAQSTKAALLSATTDKENSKKLVISMYKALEEERANLKLCKSELETCKSRCLEITKANDKSRLDLEKMFEEKQKELALVKMLHKQEVESIRALGVELGRSQGIAMAEESSAQLRHTMRGELADKQNEVTEARKEKVKIRQNMASLQNEHEKEVAELKEVIGSLLSKEQSKDGLILELSDVVRSQKAQLQSVNFSMDKLVVAEKELQRRQQEISDLKVQTSRCDDLVQKVESLQQKLAEISQDANQKAENEKNFLSKLSSLQQENTELASSIKRLEGSKDAVKIKNKMLESQNESIRELKEELCEAREAFSRVLKTSETHENEWIKRLHNEVEKCEDLRTELNSQALTVDALEEKLKVERVAKLAAEKTSKLLQQKVEEKEEMLRYVEDEISQVKTLYDNKVRATAAERDQAMEELRKTRKEMEQTKAELLQNYSELEAKRRRELSVEAQESRDLREARSSLQNQVEVLKAAISEKDLQLKETGQRVLELENQLDNQTLAMEKQKAVASLKVEQLRKVVEDLGDLK